MRGARYEPAEGEGHEGIIPAYAGSTPSASPKPSSKRDHPRVCGEHGDRVKLKGGQQGSSPRMRGARCRGEGMWRHAGIIPAYAGSTLNSTRLFASRKDHPRVCGEHVGPFLMSMTLVGSSPRMRGAHAARNPLWLYTRIIPAYAGSTGFPNLHLLTGWDHPRVCGEHGDRVKLKGGQQGSSPRMRGALSWRGSTCRVWRIIPAYAGSTVPVAPRPGLPEDHPRVCGEHSVPKSRES